VGRAELTNSNIWVFEHTGALRSGWPQLKNLREVIEAGLSKKGILAGFNPICYLTEIDG
jgi:hypothetical protein